MKLLLKAFVRPHVRTHPVTGARISVNAYTNSKPSKTVPHHAPINDSREWIAIDLDKVLASHAPGSGLSAIGHPIPKMMARVKRWLREGERVKIFTARATDKKQIPIIQAWLKEHGLPKLEITNIKDPFMKQLFDDKAFHVRPNRGVIVWR